MHFYVYCHTNKINNKKYFGITSQNPPSKRWGCNGRNYNEEHQPHFARAIRKYGWDNFSHEVLAEGLTESEAKKLEIQLIAEYKTTDYNLGYNKSFGGDGNVKYPTEELKKSAATRNKIKSAAIRTHKLKTNENYHAQALQTRQTWYNRVKNDPEHKAKYKKYSDKAKQNYKQKLENDPELAKKINAERARKARDQYQNDEQARQTRLEANREYQARVREVKKALKKLYDEDSTLFLPSDVATFTGSKQSRSINKLSAILNNILEKISKGE